MKLYEKYGLVTGNNSYRNLCKLIVLYMYDIENGLNADPFYDPNEGSSISVKNITSYAKYIGKTYDSPLVPEWIGSFIVNLKPFSTSGYCKAKEFKNGKVWFEVNIDESKVKTPGMTFSTLMHEFKHAYDFYIEKSKGIQMVSDHDNSRYNLAVNRICLSEDIDIDFLITGYYLDGVIIDDNIYNDIESIKNMLVFSLYITNNKEISSYKENFNASLDNLLIAEKDKSEDFSPYNISIYRLYAAYKMFWENTNKISEEVKEEFCVKEEMTLRQSGFIYTRNIDYEDVFKRMVKMFVPKLNTALKAFEKIFKHRTQDF